VTALETLAARIGRHGTIYGAGTASALVFGLVQVAVLTRLLDLAEFGQLAILLVFSGLLTIVYNLGTLQGSLSRVFGSTGGGDDEGADLPLEEGARRLARDKRHALGTGIALTALVSGVCTLGLALAAPTVADLLLHDRSATGAVVWAAVAGALGAIWRLVSNVLRMERRPGSFAVVNTTRPVLVVAAVIPLVAAGGGVAAAMAGVAAGTALSLGVGLVATRRSYSFAFSSEEARAILSRGWNYVPIVLGLWVINNADLLLLSAYAPDPDVGLYRVASRVAAVMSYAVSAFMMAWGPLSRTPLYAAVEKERGWASAGSSMATYFTLGVVGMVLALAIGADVLVRIAPPSYSEAASLIPLIGAGLALGGLVVLVYRVATFAHKRSAFTGLTVVSAIVFLLSALLLIPAWGSSGAALSVIIGHAAGLAGMLLLSQRGTSPLPLEYRRIALGTAAAGACFLVAKLAAAALPKAAFGEDVAAFLAFPVLLVVLGVIPRKDLRSLHAAGRFLVPVRTEQRELAARLMRLSPERYTVLRLVTHDRHSLDEVTEMTGTPKEAVLSRFMAALRELAGLEPSSEADPRVADYLLSPQPVAERDQLARRLWSGGADPLELDALTLTFDRLRRIRRSAWNGAPGRSRTREAARA